MTHRASTVTRRVATLAVAAVLTGSASSTATPATQEVGHETVIVRRAHWPVRVLPRGDDGRATRVCADLAPSDVELLWNGEPLTVSAVDPRPLARTHALLIDTSHSMVEDRLERESRFTEAKRAAIAYLERLPADERVLVASFDETLLLRTPPTFDRESARRAIDRLEISYYTALWDSVYYLTLYLAGLPGEKVIVLLSDGQDFGSTRKHGYDELLELAGSVENLAIFPVGLALPRAGNSRIKHQLYTLANETGGHFYEVERAALLTRLFGLIADRLESQRYLVFAPPAPDGEEGGRVKIKVRALPGVPCRIRSLGSADWYAAPSALSWGELAPLPPGEVDRLRDRGLGEAASCLGPDEPQAVGELARLAVATGVPGYPNRDAVLGPLATERGLVGQVADILVERGPLFRRKTYRRTGELRVGGAGRPVKQAREILVVTPPLRTIRRQLTGPSEILLFMLTQDLCAPSTETRADLRAPFLVHGRTFVEIRELLGRAMFRAREDYRDWAAGLAAEAATREMELLLATWKEEAGRPGEVALEDLRREVALQAADPRSGRPHEFLVEWLGDVTAQQAAAALEVDLANTLLVAGEDRHAAEQRAARVESVWDRLGRWFPPAFDLRIVALLLPAYDPERDVVGFYRFVLPRPRSDDVEPRPLPERPLGLRTVRWLLDRTGARAAIAGRAEVLDVDYGPVSRRAVRRAGCPTAMASDPGATAVALTLATTEPAESPGLLYVAAYYPGPDPAVGAAPSAPACFRIEAGEGSAPGLVELQRRLEEVVSADQ